MANMNRMLAMYACGKWGSPTMLSEHIGQAEATPGTSQAAITKLADNVT